MNAMVISAGTLSSTPKGLFGGSGASHRPHQLPLAAAPVKLTLTRRGRLVLFGLPALVASSILVFVALAIVFSSLASPAHAGVENMAVDMDNYAHSVTVLQGDSLWSIAGATNPNRDVRDVVREIVALNELGTGVLQAGQRLFVPIPK
ncbi:LysM peptidoglycan-binding domain-containing protein [Arthrobacter sp. HLT1-20]